MGLLGKDLPNPNGTITAGFLRNWCFQRPGMLDTSRFPLSRPKLCPARVLLMLRRPLSLFMECPQAVGPCTSKISSFFRQHITYKSFCNADTKHHHPFYRARLLPRWWKPSVSPCRTLIYHGVFIFVLMISLNYSGLVLLHSLSLNLGAKIQSRTPPCGVFRALGSSFPCDAHGAEGDATSLRSAIPLPVTPGI